MILSGNLPIPQAVLYIVPLRTKATVGNWKVVNTTANPRTFTLFLNVGGPTEYPFTDVNPTLAAATLAEGTLGMTLVPGQQIQGVTDYGGGYASPGTTDVSYLIEVIESPL
jgi:hypothetical protein